MSKWLTPQLKAAILRAFYGAVVVAGLAFFTALSQGASVQVAAIAAGTAAVGYLAARGGVEGLYDGNRALKGDVKPQDVAYYGGMPPPRG